MFEVETMVTVCGTSWTTLTVRVPTVYCQPCWNRGGSRRKLLILRLVLCHLFRGNYKSRPTRIVSHFFTTCVSPGTDRPRATSGRSLYTTCLFLQPLVASAVALCDVRCGFSSAGAMGKPKHALHRNGIRLRGAHRQPERIGVMRRRVFSLFLL